MTGLWLNLPITLGVTVVAISGVFALAVRRGRYDLIDSYWGLGFAVVAVVTFLLSIGDGDLLPRVLATALTVVWGVRLAAHIHSRNRKKDEDPRYVEMAAKGGAGRMFVRVYLTQAAILWFVSLPVQFAQYGHGGPSWPIWLGVAVWLVGFVFETVGDRQLSAFRADPDSSGQVLDTGLWRYTRHPNYFGDACVWWGLYLIACHSWIGAATILSPLVMTFLLAKGTGKPMLEKQMAHTRPGYAEYVARTSGFVPLPPKKTKKETTR
jgi:steroid 5-alpha reductase family enzyme